MNRDGSLGSISLESWMLDGVLTKDQDLWRALSIELLNARVLLNVLELMDSRV